MKYLLLLFSFNAFALEVIKPDYTHKDIELNIIRAYPDSWETYTLVHSNSRQMLLVCAQNRVYDDNPMPYIEYRNFYNIKAAKFILPSDKVCKELGQFIEQAHMAIDEDNYFKIIISRKTMSVQKIIYPKVDPLADNGEMEDLLPKGQIVIKYKDNKVKIKRENVGTLN